MSSAPAPDHGSSNGNTITASLSLCAVVEARRRNNGDEVDTEGHSFCGGVGINDDGVVSLRLCPGYGVGGPGPAGGPQSPETK
ncbi:hypothetical protein ACFX2I_038835 [Malus domestica]